MSCKKSISVLLLLAAICVFADHSGAQLFTGQAGNFTFRGNKIITIPASVTDTFYIQDPITNETKMLKSTHDGAVVVNGEKIYKMNEVTTPPVANIPNTPFDEYLVGKVLKDINLQKLSDGNLRIYIKEIVIDSSGNLAYYFFRSVTFMGKDGEERTLVNDYENLDPFTDVPSLKPATLNDKHVAVQLDLSLSDFDIELHDHIATYKKRLPYLRNAPLAYTVQ